MRSSAPPAAAVTSQPRKAPSTPTVPSAAWPETRIRTSLRLAGLQGSSLLRAEGDRRTSPRRLLRQYHLDLQQRPALHPVSGIEGSPKCRRSCEDPNCQPGAGPLQLLRLQLQHQLDRIRQLPPHPLQSNRSHRLGRHQWWSRSWLPRLRHRRIDCPDCRSLAGQQRI